MDFTREWHNVTLPSLGKYYNDKLPDGKLKVTPWTVTQEEAIARSSEGEPNLDLTTELLKQNVAWPEGFQYEDLLTTDQFFLLLRLRAVSLLDFMTLRHGCEKCGNVESVEVDLNNIVVRTPDDTDPDEPYTCFLPKRRVKIEVRHQRVGDLLAAERYLASAIVVAPEHRRKFLYARQIMTVDGNTPKFDEKLTFVSSLSLIDLNVISARIEKYATGVRGTYPVTCSNCGTPDERWVPPIHSDFFRPKPSDIERACRMAEED